MPICTWAGIRCEFEYTELGNGSLARLSRTTEIGMWGVERIVSLLDNGQYRK